MNNLKISENCQIENLKEIYLQYFNKTNGIFVEVGAFDGEAHSNTSGLADLGWQGIYIEPIPEYMNRCMARHSNNNVKFEPYAISVSSGITNMHVAGGLSTLSEYVHHAHKNLFDACHFNDETIINVQTIRLDEIFSKHDIPKNFDLLVVDVEGHEQQVFDSFSIIEYRPKMIIVELSDVCSLFDSYPEMQNSHYAVRTLLIQQGYKEIYVDPINTILIDTESDLIKYVTGE